MKLLPTLVIFFFIGLPFAACQGEPPLETAASALTVLPPLKGEETQGPDLVGDVVGGAWSVQLPAGIALVRGMLAPMPAGDPFALVGTVLLANVGSRAVQLRIDAIEKPGTGNADEYLDTMDPTGSTLLYTISYRSIRSGRWAPMCAPDRFGSLRSVVVAGTWDDRGDFSLGAGGNDRPIITFGCFSGAIAKCVKWGYQPWPVPDPSQPGQMLEALLSCTRAARADYCGNGDPHTMPDTPVDVWDRISPHPRRFPDAVPPTDGREPITFEAGWGPRGALCITHARWAVFPPGLCAATSAPLFDREKQPRLCDTADEAVRLSLMLTAIGDPDAEPVPIFIDSAVNNPL